MAKLTKQEINAITNRLHRKLLDKSSLNKKRAMYEYIPSPTYTNVEDNLKLISSLEQQIQETRKKIETLGTEVNKILKSKEIDRPYFNWYETVSYHEEYLRKLIETELNIEPIPSIEELRENLVIAAIDTDFDVDKYIEEQLNM